MQSEKIGMAIVELVIPKMGESIHEATIISWLKKEGDIIEEDETILEIATDKVDSDVPSPIGGTVHKILAQVNEVVPVGQTVALIETFQSPEKSNSVSKEESAVQVANVEPEPQQQEALTPKPESVIAEKEYSKKPSAISTNRFYSPLVKTIARQEGVSIAELETIFGTGPKNRVTKEDIFRYVNELKQKENKSIPHPTVTSNILSDTSRTGTQGKGSPQLSTGYNDQKPRSHKMSDEVIELDRMRKMISEHMISSINTSAHVSSFVEVDVTKMVLWREKAKKVYLEKYGVRLTFSPLFAEAVILALKDFPTINASLIEDKLIIKKNINLGIATALPNGNLIVPVIEEAQSLNLLGLAKKLNDLSQRARDNKLKPNEIQGGTFTISNIGTFGNLMGTPIINQPQLAILAIGAIKKKPVIMETDHGDIIAIRHMMFLSLSFDHRVIDGFLGGSFLNRIAENIENFDSNRQI